MSQKKYERFEEIDAVAKCLPNQKGSKSDEKWFSFVEPALRYPTNVLYI